MAQRKNVGPWRDVSDLPAHVLPCLDSTARAVRFLSDVGDDDLDVNRDLVASDVEGEVRAYVYLTARAREPMLCHIASSRPEADAYLRANGFVLADDVTA
jgi:hypothetical protein